MPKPDPYTNEAIASARQFEIDEPRFKLVDLHPTQGKNNRVLRGTFDGAPVVLKYYGDGFKSSTPSALRKLREITFLRHAHGTGFVPGLLAKTDRLVVMELIEGEPLAIQLRRMGLRSATAETALQIGAAHRTLSDLHLESAKILEIESACFGGITLGERIENLLEGAAGFSGRDLLGGVEKNSLEKIRDLSSVFLSEPRVLYRYDNNLGNVLVDTNGQLLSLVDFEQCFVGTPTLYLGAIFDCAHAVPWSKKTEPGIFQQLPWEALAEGVGIDPSAGTMQLIVVAAMVNHWIRILDVQENHPDLTAWIPRLRPRFAAYLKALD
jgi:hypothetical protein